MPSYLGFYQGCASDRERKFIRAVTSFLQQEYKNRELLIVSDGCEITNRIVAENFPHDVVKLISIQKQDLFSGEVRDAGLRQATGDVITYLDSVTGDRCVPVKINDVIDAIPLEDLFEKFKFLSYYKGEKEIIDIPKSIGVYTLTPDKKIKCDYSNAEKIFKSHFNENQHDIIKLLDKGFKTINICNELNKPYATVLQSIKQINKKINRGIYYITGKWTRIEKLIRHFVINKDTYKVGQKLAQTEITKDHSLIDIIDDKYTECNFDVFKTKGFHVISEFEVDRIKNFKLSDYINSSNYDLSNDRLNVVGNDGKNWMVNVYDNESEIMSLMRLLGFYVAEGSTSKRKSSKVWSVDNTDKKYLKILMKDIKNISSVRYNMVESKKEKYKSCFKLQVYNKLFTDIFPELCGEDCRDKKIPSFIFSLEEKYINEFLKFMYYGDGSTLRKNSVYTTTSLKLISGLSLILKSMKKDHTITYRHEKDSWGLISREDVVVRANPKIFKVIKNNKPKFVYDIQVEDKNHIFVDACGCLLLHNTDDKYGNSLHLDFIYNAFLNLDVNWVYFDDIMQWNPHVSSSREVFLERGRVGTSNIAHRNFKDIGWKGMNGYGHDWSFITQLMQRYPNPPKISGTSYTVCHIPNVADV